MSNAEQFQHCNKWFTVHQRPMGVPGGKDREPINCAHFGLDAREEMTDVSWFTEKARSPHDFI